MNGNETAEMVIRILLSACFAVVVLYALHQRERAKSLRRQADTLRRLYHREIDRREEAEEDSAGEFAGAGTTNAGPMGAPVKEDGNG